MNIHVNNLNLKCTIILQLLTMSSLVLKYPLSHEEEQVRISEEVVLSHLTLEEETVFRRIHSLFHSLRIYHLYLNTVHHLLVTQFKKWFK